jgi:hypothetical protein
MVGILNIPLSSAVPSGRSFSFVQLTYQAGLNPYPQFLAGEK